MCVSGPESVCLHAGAGLTHAWETLPPEGTYSCKKTAEVGSSTSVYSMQGHGFSSMTAVLAIALHRIMT